MKKNKIVIYTVLMNLGLLQAITAWGGWRSYPGGIAFETERFQHESSWVALCLGAVGAYYWFYYCRPSQADPAVIALATSDLAAPQESSGETQTPAEPFNVQAAAEEVCETLTGGPVDEIREDGEASGSVHQLQEVGFTCLGKALKKPLTVQSEDDFLVIHSESGLEAQ